MCQIIHLQRQQVCLYQLYEILFSPVTTRLYAGIKYFSGPVGDKPTSNQASTQLRNNPLTKAKDEARLSVALG
jgi:hypothetical protein